MPLFDPPGDDGWAPPDELDPPPQPTSTKIIVDRNIFLNELIEIIFWVSCRCNTFKILTEIIFLGFTEN